MGRAYRRYFYGVERTEPEIIDPAGANGLPFILGSAA
jgi:hypothetical protein